MLNLIKHVWYSTKIHSLKTTISILVLATVLITATGHQVVYADDNEIKLISANFISEFPNGFRILAKAQSSAEITSIALRIRIGQQTAGSYDYLDFDQGKNVSGEMLWRTNTLGSYIPPGTIITYSFEIKDSEDNFLKTVPSEFIYHDPKFDWVEITDGTITVAYHGPVETRAKIVLDAMTETIAIMGPLLGAESKSPIRVTLYNNKLEMVRAQPPRSAAIARNTTTLGQAFASEGVLLVLGNRDARGTASHEITHILVHRAADSPGRSIPAWLNEGLAEFGNLDSGPEFDIALEFAIATKSLKTTKQMNTPPGNPTDLIMFYGQSRSLVKFMVNQFGPENMTRLLNKMKLGAKIEDAIEDTYGMSLVNLENLWRISIGAETYDVAKQAKNKPTPVPLRKIGLYSLTPKPDTEAVAGSSETPTPIQVAVEQTSSDVTTTEASVSSGCTAHHEGAGLDITTAGLFIGLLLFRYRPKSNY